jgi:hypothetical protein
MLAVADEVADALARIPVDTTFWGLPAVAIGAVPAAAGSVGWCVWRAWEVLMGVPQVNVAVAHKTLHHKRPWLFPLLDSQTEPLYPHGAWAAIHSELTSQATQFGELEGWFAALAAERVGVSLTRLRLHDILSWGDAAGQRAALDGAGGPGLGPARRGGATRS